MQVIVTCATVTEHDDALYSTPVTPYVAVTTLPLVGPKFVPVNVTTVPPPVDIELPPEMLVMFGAVYDISDPDNALG